MSFYEPQALHEGLSKWKDLAHLKQEEKVSSGDDKHPANRGLESEPLPHDTVKGDGSVQFPHHSASTVPSLKPSIFPSWVIIHIDQFD